MFYFFKENNREIGFHKILLDFQNKKMSSVKEALDL